MAQVGSTAGTTLVRSTPQVWTRVDVADEAIPTTTRTIRLKMRMVRTDGTNNDGYFDDLDAFIHI